MDLRFAHMHKQFSHSIIRSFESLTSVSLAHSCMNLSSVSGFEVQVVLMSAALQMDVFVFATQSEAEEAYLLMQKLWQNDEKKSMKSARKKKRRSDIGAVNEDDMELTDSDWNRVLKNSKLERWNSESIVMEKSVVYNKLYRIEKGTIRVEFTSDPTEKQPRVLFKLNPGDLFDSMSFAEESPTHFAFVAEDLVEARGMEASFLGVLWGVDKNLFARFWRFVALSLARVSEGSALASGVVDKESSDSE
jgi:hypothetical protein